MANSGAVPQMDPSNGGGGSGWERNMSAGPSLQYDTTLGRYVLGYLMEDGRVIPAEDVTGPQQDTRESLPGGSGPSLPLRGLPKLTSQTLPTVSNLGKVASVLDTATNVGSALAGILKGRQDGRATDATFNQRQDQNSLDRYNAEANGQRLNLQAPQYRMGTAVRGDILSNAQDFVWGAPQMVGNIPVPTSTGGLRPSMLSANTRRLGALAGSQAYDQQQTNGGNVMGPPPSLTPLPNGGTLDSILNTAGTLSTLMGVLPYKRNQTGGQ